MTHDRETRLRQKLDDYRDEIERLEERLTSVEARKRHLAALARKHGLGANGRKLKRCPWCGEGCHGQTCRKHRVIELRYREAVGA